jgi:hypothetical protein
VKNVEVELAKVDDKFKAQQKDERAHNRNLSRSAA